MYKKKVQFHTDWICQGGHLLQQHRMFLVRFWPPLFPLGPLAMMQAFANITPPCSFNLPFKAILDCIIRGGETKEQQVDIFLHGLPNFLHYAPNSDSGNHCFPEYSTLTWSHYPHKCTCWGHWRGPSLLLLPDFGILSHRRLGWPHLCCLSARKRLASLLLGNCCLSGVLKYMVMPYFLGHC